MPCPYFEPLEAVHDPRDEHARLPLIEEYAGLCHAQSPAEDAPAESRFRFCNHGNSQKACERYPAAAARSCARFHVIDRTADLLRVLYVEENDFVPVNWSRLLFFPASGQLEPEIEDTCLRAQTVAFCRSYLRRFIR